MSYHIYRFGEGCLWMEDMDKAVEKFMSFPMDEQPYTAIGISEGGYAVDVVIKGEYAGKGELLCSRDIKQSILFQEHPESTIDRLKELYKAIGVKEEHATEIIDSLTEMALMMDTVTDEMDEDDDLEEM
jgi:KaiC/GvpD/RAD55 family RecA-like ATPase